MIVGNSKLVSEDIDAFSQVVKADGSWVVGQCTKRSNGLVALSEVVPQSAIGVAVPAFLCRVSVASTTLIRRYV